MTVDICYTVGRAGTPEVSAHLMRTDASFGSALSSRVDIQAYAKKLHENAVRFEAWMSQELVGLVAAYCNQKEAGTSFVTNVSVWPEFKRQGIAGLLMRQCISHVESLEFSQIILEVDQGNLAALALYQKFGFKTLSSRGSMLTMGMKLGSRTI